MAALRIAPNLSSITEALGAITIAIRQMSGAATAAMPVPGPFERDVNPILDPRVGNAGTEGRRAYNVGLPIPLLVRSIQVAAPPAPTQGPVYVVYDFETTGLGKTADIRIRQVGAKAMNAHFKPIGTFSKFVNPVVPTSKGAKKVCGITKENEEMVASMPKWDITGTDFQLWCEEMRGNNQDIPMYLIAHNGKRYDARILCFENQRHMVPDWQVNKHSVDSIDLFKKLHPGQATYKLGDLYHDVFGTPMKNAHDALADVDGVISLLNYFDQDDVVDAIDMHSESFNAVLKRCMKS